MNTDIARRHVRALIDEVLTDETGELLLKDESFISSEIDKCITAVFSVANGRAITAEIREAGLGSYAETFRERLAQQFPKGIRQEE